MNLERWLASLVIVEMQRKTTVEGCSVRSIIQKCLNLVLLRASEEADHQEEHLTHFQREINWSSCLGNQVDIALHIRMSTFHETL